MTQSTNMPQVMAVGGEAPESLLVDLTQGEVTMGDAFAATRDFSLKSVIPSIESEDRFAKTLEELLASRNESE